MLKIGDTVVYSQPHYLWLVSAAKWPSKQMKRRDLRGVVTTTEDAPIGRGPVQVLWPNRLETWHFADNLELVRQP